MKTSKRIVLRFPQRLVDRPIVYHLIRDYDLAFNILKASITPDKEGLMVLEITGEREAYDKGIAYLNEAGVKIDALNREVTRNEHRCTHCGACVTMCPVYAFSIDEESREIKFDAKKCIVCGICIQGCPPRAMELHF
ncbi:MULTISPECIES: NIL domain-containing protein [Dehalococcoides]|jgi:ferredoxin|uniref:(Fe-S)-binding protein n=1 Tax=Dehalococcoides mccartyi TaxID=61435 RepID=A0A1S6SH75_9CHLR|nr:MULTISPECIES: NIL domain-containing protein [Dehalococcoides]AGG06465.1 (NIL) domain-containing ferredoxin [Dehalococcoides mccartyi DCMB5]AGG07904.1 (NIL) domain-containing ferredoxin [Dehalococcoides mccartyi BTF08]AQU05905.1 (Fe-S)-binding protein [Dehalococcoides mccartyi]AQU07350.1 (Fe-S)-binding protein [Dehalococcoides mccartyi]AQW62454.1 (Fe-S)-binding protein [Dehalococcoides mccartyi]